MPQNQYSNQTSSLVINLVFKFMREIWLVHDNNLYNMVINHITIYSFLNL